MISGQWHSTSGTHASQIQRGGSCLRAAGRFFYEPQPRVHDVYLTTWDFALRIASHAGSHRGSILPSRSALAPIRLPRWGACRPNLDAVLVAVVLGFDATLANRNGHRGHDGIRRPAALNFRVRAAFFAAELRFVGMSILPSPQHSITREASSDAESSAWFRPHSSGGSQREHREGQGCPIATCRKGGLATNVLGRNLLARKVSWRKTEKLAKWCWRS